MNEVQPPARPGSGRRPSIFPQRPYAIALLAFFSLVGLALGIYALRVNPRDGIVPESSLLETSGKLSWMKEYLYGVRFGLVGIAEKFDYSDKTGDIATVRAALEGLSIQTVTVRYAPQTHTALDSKYAYHNVWALTVDNRKIRTYAKSADAWGSDNRIGTWVGLFFTVGGVLLAWVAFWSFF